MPKDLGTWAFVLSIIAILLMYPVGVLINLTTPRIANSIAARGKSSLKKRISKLEEKLAALEKNPPIDEVQDEVLWGIKSVKMRIVGVENTIIVVVYVAVVVFVRPSNASSFKELSYLFLFMLALNMITILAMRYHRDFRYLRSPKNRENLRRTIRELKTILENWGRPS